MEMTYKVNYVKNGEAASNIIETKDFNIALDVFNKTSTSDLFDSEDVKIELVQLDEEGEATPFENGWMIK